jgi:death-on-curing protein
MTGEPAFLSVEQVAALHRLALVRHGGRDGLRDPAAFEGAVMHARNVWFYAQGDLFDVAAAYAFHLAEAQAFLDGNKRTGLGAALVFLEGNGVAVPAATEGLFAAMIALAERRMDKAELAAVLRRLGDAQENPQ